MTTRDKESTIILEMCQVRRGGTFPHIMIRNNNIILQLQGFLKHTDFVGKSINKFKIAMLECLIKKKSIRNRKDNSYGKIL